VITAALVAALNTFRRMYSSQARYCQTPTAIMRIPGAIGDSVRRVRVGLFVKQGRYRRIVLVTLASCFAIGVLGLGLIAAVSARPPYVTRPFLLSGGIMTVVFGCVGLLSRQQYLAAELRKISAGDLC